VAESVFKFDGDLRFSSGDLISGTYLVEHKASGEVVKSLLFR
jgi:hypothetical protein